MCAMTSNAAATTTIGKTLRFHMVSNRHVREGRRPDVEALVMGSTLGTLGRSRRAEVLIKIRRLPGTTVRTPPK